MEMILATRDYYADLVFHIPSINFRFAHFSSRQNTIHVEYQTINQINTIALIEPFALAHNKHREIIQKNIAYSFLLILCDMTWSKYIKLRPLCD